jgi:hypothetical protein
MWRLVVVVLLALGCIAILLASDEPRVTPLLSTLTPNPARAGNVVSAAGDSLGKTVVESVYLSQGDNLIKATIVSQDEQSISFKVPDNTKPGRFGVTVQTKGPRAMYIDEPVILTVE